MAVNELVWLVIRLPTPTLLARPEAAEEAAWSSAAADGRRGSAREAPVDQFARGEDGPEVGLLLMRDPMREGGLLPEPNVLALETPLEAAAEGKVAPREVRSRVEVVDRFDSVISRRFVCARVADMRAVEGGALIGRGRACDCHAHEPSDRHISPHPQARKKSLRH
eukprot:1186165-Prorocentrum_minimum.AAC.2